MPEYPNPESARAHGAPDVQRPIRASDVKPEPSPRGQRAAEHRARTREYATQALAAAGVKAEQGVKQVILVLSPEAAKTIEAAFTGGAPDPEHMDAILAEIRSQL